MNRPASSHQGELSEPASSAFAARQISGEPPLEVPCSDDVQTVRTPAGPDVFDDDLQHHQRLRVGCGRMAENIAFGLVYDVADFGRKILGVDQTEPITE